MKKNILFLTSIILSFLSCEKKNNLPDGLYAQIETNKGEIILQLEYQKAPVTVANFITLAEGKNEFVEDETLKNKPFFDGLKFHRVIENFMIQTGDPSGTGAGGTGYQFKDEFTDMVFDKGGLLAMANSGPETNSSQFFITHVETPWLNNKHTIFGHVVNNGMEVVNQIKQDDYIKKITIIRNGDAATQFDAKKVFADYFLKEKEINANLEKIITQKSTYLKTQRAKALTTNSGLAYIITKKGSNKKPAKGVSVYIDYAGFLENGVLFDTSIENTAREFGKIDPQRLEAKQYQPIPFQFGKKDGLIPGFIEGIEKLNFGDKAIIFIPSNLAYGETGAGDVIPPNTPIVFEIELLETPKK